MSIKSVQTTQRRQRGILKVDLGLALKEKWDDFNARAKAEGRKPASELREAIARLLESSMQPDLGITQSTLQNEMPDDRAKERLELRLTPSEMESLKFRAEASGLTAQSWMVALLRANLTAIPQPTGKAELEALGESNYQLLSIGRNLNQIAKRLNEGRSENFDLSDVENLRNVIRQHCGKVSKMIRANLERWKIR